MRKKIGQIAMLGAAMRGAGSPAVVTDSRASGATVKIEAQRAATGKTQQGAMQTQRSNQNGNQALFDGFGRMYRGWNQRPFAPWEAPRYNQRKARRRARQMGRKVR